MQLLYTPASFHGTLVCMFEGFHKLVRDVGLLLTRLIFRGAGAAVASGEAGSAGLSADVAFPYFLNACVLCVYKSR